MLCIEDVHVSSCCRAVESVCAGRDLSIVVFSTIEVPCYEPYVRRILETLSP